MPRRCDICSNPRRPEIDHRLLVGEPAYLIANELNLSRDSLQRHRTNHLVARGKTVRTPSGLPPRTASAALALPALPDMIHRIEQCHTALQQLLQRQDPTLVTVAVLAEMRKTVETTGRLLGLVQSDLVVNVDARQQIMIVDDLSTTVLRALRDFPEAKYAVASALKHRAGLISKSRSPRQPQ